MAKRVALVLVLFSLLGLGSGSGTAGGPGAAQAAVSPESLWAGRAAIDDLLRGGRTLVDEIDTGWRPLIIRPHWRWDAAWLWTQGEDIGRTANWYAGRIAAESGLDWAWVKQASCEYFSWYLETGVTVPSPEGFRELFINHLRGYVPKPMSVRVSAVIGQFRESIENAQSWGGLVFNVAATTACTVPTR